MVLSRKFQQCFGLKRNVRAGAGTMPCRAGMALACLCLLARWEANTGRLPPSPRYESPSNIQTETLRKIQV